MKKLTKSLLLILSVGLIISCQKDTLFETSPIKIGEKLAGAQTLDIDRQLVDFLYFADGRTVNSLPDIHEYVRINGFKDTLNGVPFYEANGNLMRHSGGLLKNAYFTLNRKKTIQGKLDAFTENFVSAIFSRETLYSDYVQSVLGIVQQRHSIWMKSNNLFDYYGLPSSQQGEKNADGLYAWQVAHIDFYDEQFKLYKLWDSYAYSLATYEEKFQKMVSSYKPLFENLIQNNHISLKYSIDDALTWALRTNIDYTIDGYYFNIYGTPYTTESDPTEKGKMAAMIVDILTDQNDQRIGVMIKISPTNILQPSYYMFVGNSPNGETELKWSSETENFNPWNKTPDFSIFNPLAVGPPTINPPSGNNI